MTCMKCIIPAIGRAFLSIVLAEPLLYLSPLWYLIATVASPGYYTFVLTPQKVLESQFRQAAALPNQACHPARKLAE